MQSSSPVRPASESVSVGLRGTQEWHFLLVPHVKPMREVVRRCVVGHQCSTASGVPTRA